MPGTLCNLSDLFSAGLASSMRDVWDASRLVGGFNEDRKHVQERAQPHEGDLQLAVDTIPGFVCTALPDGACDFLTQRWLDYADLTVEEAKGWGWTAAVCPQDLDGVLAFWRAALAAGKPRLFGVRAVIALRFEG